MKYCSKCGAPVGEAYSYCPKCGAPAENAPAYRSDQTPVAVPPVGVNPSKKGLDILHRRLGYEKTAFIVFGVLDILGALFMILLCVTMFFGAYAARDVLSSDIPLNGQTAHHDYDIYDYFDDFGEFDGFIDYGEYEEYYGDFDYYGNIYGDDAAMADIVSGILYLLAFAYLFAGIMSLVAAVIFFIQAGRIGSMMSGLNNNCEPAVRFCKSNGMIVLCVFFGWVLLVFHLVNRVTAIDFEDELCKVAEDQKMNTVNY